EGAGHPSNGNRTLGRTRHEGANRGGGFIRTLDRGGGGDRLRERLDVANVALRVLVRMPDRKRPRLLLGPRRLEHAAVLLEQPREVGDAFVDADRIAVLAYRPGRVDYGPLGPPAGAAPRRPVPAAPCRARHRPRARTAPPSPHPRPTGCRRRSPWRGTRCRARRRTLRPRH